MRATMAWMAAGAMAACLTSGAASAKANFCKDESGRTTISDRACPVIQAAASPPPAPPPCPLTAGQRSSAERLEAQFLLRFPDETSHRRAQVAELKEITLRIRSAGNRFADLRQERKTIDDELEFYRNKPVPADLARRLDASEARFAALADVFRGAENDVKSIDAQYTCKRALFAMRWHGGAPGSSACVAACDSPNR